MLTKQAKFIESIKNNVMSAFTSRSKQVFAECSPSKSSRRLKVGANTDTAKSPAALGYIRQEKAA